MHSSGRPAVAVTAKVFSVYVLGIQHAHLLISLLTESVACHSLELA